MPYNTIAELPDAVKKLPSEAQAGWMKAYNAAYKQYSGDESKANAIAWSAVQKMGYVKKGDNWVKAEYVKDLGLKPGNYLHPNKEGEELNITEQDLRGYVNNTQKLLKAGGMIPITVSHPDNEREKIELNEGDILNVWYDENEQTPYMAFNPSATVKGWIESGKLKAVSPGIYHDVVTSLGKFDTLIDHVALTNSPFNIQQSGFLPVTAEKFGKAYVFFENKYISHEQGGDVSVSNTLTYLREKIDALLHLFSKSDDTLEGGETMNLEQAKERIAELEVQHKKDQKEITSRDETVEKIDNENKTLKQKVEKFEQVEEKRKEDAKKEAIETFEAKVNKLIKEGKFQPKERDKMVETYTQMYDADIENADDILLERFKYVQPKNNQLKQNEIVVDKETYDLNTEEGKKKLSELFDERAKELHAKDPKGEGHTDDFYFERAQEQVCEEHNIDSATV
jgi:cation transport regulator ChaB